MAVIELWLAFNHGPRHISNPLPTWIIRHNPGHLRVIPYRTEFKRPDRPTGFPKRGATQNHRPIAVPIDKSLSSTPTATLGRSIQ